MSMQNKARANKYPYLIGLCSILIFGFIIPQKDNSRTKLLDAVSAQLAKEIVTDKDQCLSVTIVKNDSIVYFKGFGHMDKRHKIIPDSSTIFRLGSVTKSFTAVLMLQLADEGYFKLDEPVEKYLPEIRSLQGYTDSTKITFRQLASHTAGLERDTKTNDLLYCSTSQWESKIVLAIAETKFAIKPNTAMLYSNIGYNILGLAISRAAKVSYLTLINNRIFVPLGMNNSYFEIPKDKKDNLAVSSDAKATVHEYRAWQVASGGIYSTAVDLSKFTSMLMGFSKQKILSDRSLALLKKFTSADSNGGYSFGMMLYTKGNTLIMGHTGSTHGYNVCYAFDNLNRNTVILLLNFDTEHKLWGPSINILKQLADLDHKD